MPVHRVIRETRKRTGEGGFTLLEMLIALGVLLSVSAIVLEFMFSMAMNQASVANRTDMHSGVRSATEVLQQEISQAGRIALPNGSTTIVNDVTANVAAQTISVASSAGMYQNMLLVISPRGPSNSCPGTCEEEVVEITNDPAGTNQIIAIFAKSHGAGATVRAAGGAIEGILTVDNGTVLEMFGDINDDGEMVYIRYECAPEDDGTGTLRRWQMPWNTPVADIGNFEPQTLLATLQTNPPDAISGDPVPCFAFQTKAAGWMALDGITPRTAEPVVNVAITMTARTQLRDLQTNQYQFETKALLTVSPRNAFQAWQMSTLSAAPQHVQITPQQIIDLADAM